MSSPHSISYYQPHSEETKRHYEDLLQCIQRIAPPGSYDSLQELGEDVLAIVCAKDNSGRDVSEINAQRHRQLEALFDSSLSPHVRRELLDYGRLITDYVFDDAAAQNAAERGLGDDDVREQHSESDEDDTADGKKPLSKLHKDKKLSHFAFDAAGATNEALEGFLQAEEEEPDEGVTSFLDEMGLESSAGGPAPIPFEEVAANANYIKDSLRRLFPSQSAEVCSTQAQRVFEYLCAIHVDTLTVETQLTAFLGGYDDDAVMKWIGDACASRWELVYGLSRAKATSEKERMNAMVAMEKHAMQDRQVETLYQRLTGKEVDVLKRNEDGNETNEGSRQRPLRAVNIDFCVFPEERSPYQHRRVPVPPGTKKATFDTHDEVTLPPSSSAKPTDTLVPISSLPEWCQPAFTNVKSLNAMQSRTFPCAFGSEANLLVSAPTGAGKTNVALLTMLRAIHNARDPETGAIRLRELKMVYIAPMKALVQEVVFTFKERLAPLGLEVAELSGDTTTTQAQLLHTQLIVATPEKWDIVTRKSVELGVASLISLLIIDEVHLLHNERGAVLEAIVARTFLQQQCRGSGGIRLVGLSATLPNWQDVASFLQVDREHGAFVFDSSYRPIPLEQSFCAVKKEQGKTQVTTMNSIVYDKVLECVERGEQSLVFVHSRKDTAYTASFLKTRATKEHRSETFVRPDSESKRILQEEAEGVLHPSLKQLLPFGFGIHHAGLGVEERALVERLFSERHVKVLVCTSTLAWGVNLPANQVIIKGTRVFNAAKGRSDLLSALDVLQMFGRAGRAGFGSSLGRAAIITSAEDLHYYLCVLNQRLPIESHLMKRVVDMLNAEVVLGHIESTAQGVKWLQRSYMYVRMRQEPELYGAQPSEADPLLLHHLECIVHTCCEALRKAQLVHYDPHSRTVSATPFGRIASYYYVSAASMSSFLSHLTNNMHDSDLFRVFSLASEFSLIPVRHEEQSQMRQLLEEVPIAVRESRYTPLAKINVLLQCYISRKALEGLPLMSEIGYVKDSAQRILRALYEICIKKEFGRTARQCLELFLMTLHQQWAVESPIRQVLTLLSVKDCQAILLELERIRVPFDEMREWTVEDWKERLSDNRRADSTYAAVHAVPQYLVEASLRPLTRAMVYVDVDITPAFIYHADVHTPPIRVTEVVLLIEHTNGRLIHTESVLLPLECVQNRILYSCPPIVVPMVENPRPTHLIVRCVSPHWLLASSSAAVSLMNTKLPDLSPPLREVERKLGGDEGALDVANVMAKYKLESVASAFFPFTEFYLHQREVVETVMECETDNMFVGVPPGGGKTAIAELFVLQFLLSAAMKAEDRAAEGSAGKGSSPHVEGQEEAGGEDGERDKTRKTKRPIAPPAHPKLLYLTVSEEVAARRYIDWSCRFDIAMKVKVVKLDPLCHDPDHLAEAVKDGCQVVVASGSDLIPLVRREESLLLQDVTHIIVDHVHLIRSAEGRFMEECLARLLSPPFIVGNGSKPRVLALSYPLISAVEVCRWLRVTASRQYNFSNSCRQLRVRVEGLELPNPRGRYETGVIAALQTLQKKQYASLPSVIFVPTDRDAEEVASRVLIRCRPHSLPKNPATTEMDDPRLALLLAGGVGYLHRDVSPSDHAFLLERLFGITTQATAGDETVGEGEQGGAPLILVCAFHAAPLLPAAAFNLAVITTTDRLVRRGSAPSSNYEEEAAGDAVRSVSASELLQMVSRAGQEAVVFCPMSKRWVWSKLLNEPLPLESALRYPEDFADSVNAAVANKRAKTKIDVLRILSTHYFLYHLKTNPHFYSVPSAEDIPLYASDLTFRVVKWLEERGYVRVEGEQDGADNPKALLFPLPRGAALVEHSISIQSVEAMDQQLRDALQTQRLSLSTMWRVVACGCHELSAEMAGESVEWYDGEELNAFFTVARLLPDKFGVSFVNLDFKEPGMKLFLLGLANCAAFLRTPQELDDEASDNQHPFAHAQNLAPEDLKLLLSIPSEVAFRIERAFFSLYPRVLHILRGVVRLLVPSVRGGSWLPVRYLMHFVQNIQQRGWEDAEDQSRMVQTLKAVGSVDSPSQEMMFVVNASVTLSQPMPSRSLWWLSCVVSSKRGDTAREGSEMVDRVLAVEEVANEAGAVTFHSKLSFPLTALEGLDLDEAEMSAVLVHQLCRIDVEAVVKC